MGKNKHVDNGSYSITQSILENKNSRQRLELEFAKLLPHSRKKVVVIGAIIVDNARVAKEKRGSLQAIRKKQEH